MFEPGIYEVMSTVNVRKEPRVTWTNKVGQKSAGTRVQVYSVQTNNDNSTWGRISEPDAAGVALWCCIQEVNRQFLKFVKPVEAPADTRIELLEKRLDKLTNWARVQGYKEYPISE